MCAVTAVLLLGACSSSAKRAEPPSEMTTTTVAPTTTTTVREVEAPKSQANSSEADLEALLVPAADVPSGFTRQATTPKPDTTKACDTISIPPGTPTAEVSYVGGNVAVLSEQLISYASAPAAATEMRNARTALEGCKSYDKKDAKGAVTRYTVAPLPFGRLAADQVALRLMFTSEKLDGTVDVVIARVGNVVMVTSGLSASASASPGAAPLKAGDFASFTRTAYRRLG